jgi:hypothetical protein
VPAPNKAACSALVGVTFLLQAQINYSPLSRQFVFPFKWHNYPAPSPGYEKIRLVHGSQALSIGQTFAIKRTIQFYLFFSTYQ